MRIIDRIIQITDTLTNEGDGQTLGLGESGTLYRLLEKGHMERYDETPSSYKNRYILDSRVWEVYLDSPEKDTP